MSNVLCQVTKTRSRLASFIHHENLSIFSSSDPKVELPNSQAVKKEGKLVSDVEAIQKWAQQLKNWRLRKI